MTRHCVDDDVVGERSPDWASQPRYKTNVSLCYAFLQIDFFIALSSLNTEKSTILEKPSEAYFNYNFETNVIASLNQYKYIVFNIESLHSYFIVTIQFFINNNEAWWFSGRAVSFKSRGPGANIKLFTP